MQIKVTKRMVDIFHERVKRNGAKVYPSNRTRVLNVSLHHVVYMVGVNSMSKLDIDVIIVRERADELLQANAGKVKCTNEKLFLIQQENQLRLGPPCCCESLPEEGGICNIERYPKPAKVVVIGVAVQMKNHASLHFYSRNY